MATAAIKRTFTTSIYRDGSMCFFEVPFDPKEAFGKIRAPVKVHLPKHTYRSTIASMGGCICVPLRRSNREAAGLEGGETVEITLELDTEKREVELPADLKKALKAASALEGWNALSYSHQMEHAVAIAEAKKPETRERRIAAAVAMIAAKATPKAAKTTKAQPKAAKAAAAAKAAKTAKAQPKAAKTSKRPAKARRRRGSQRRSQP